jgi:hypothetical protein
MTAQYDAQIIPGGGILRKDGQYDLPPWIKRRLDRTIEIHRGEYIILLSAGTVHKPPPLDNLGFPVFESVAGAEYLLNKGIEPALILCETASYDTIGNAYFARLLHVDPLGLRNLLIVNNQYHMPRTQAIFQWIFGLEGSHGDDRKYYQLDFESVTDDGIEKEMLQARKKREKASLKHVLKMQKTIRDLKAFHRWFYTEHKAYAVAAAPERVSGKTLDMY